MATKKATYQYDNGSGWDEIMFKTTSDQVVESSTKRFVSDTEKSNWNTAVTRANDWNSFKTNGGQINGHIELNSGRSFIINSVGWIGTGSNTEFEMIQTNKGKVVRLGTTDNLGNHIFTGLDGNDGVFGPSHNNLVSLGKSSNVFKDLWLGSSSRSSNGYSRLPNGMIMQWGEITLPAGTGRTSKNLPMTYPTSCLSVTVSVLDMDNTSAANNCRLLGFNNTQISVASSTSIKNLYAQFIAIGY